MDHLLSPQYPPKWVFSARACPEDADSEPISLSEVTLWLVAVRVGTQISLADTP